MTRFCAALWWLLAGQAWAADAQLRVDGTELIVTDEAGVEQRGAALDGAELDLGPLGTLKLQHSAKDATARFPDELWLLEGQLRKPETSEFAELCPPDPKGDKRMLLYSGYLDPELHYVADRSRFSMSCVSGVEAKCLRWGYLPWKQAPIGGTSLAPYFETCIRLARADYCGNDQATTRDGTSIDLYDQVGVQQRTPDLPTYAFEAGWGPSGALCVHHPRIPENLVLDKLPLQCPRLAQAPLGDGCTEDWVNEQGALMISRSVIRVLPVD
jgi:hypothetical protein